MSLDVVSSAMTEEMISHVSAKAMIGRGLLDDVSPDFNPNHPLAREDARVAKQMIPLAKTPRAIKHFVDVHRKLSNYFYWFLLGTLWVDYTGWSDLQTWRWMFSSFRPNRETSLMKPSEFREFCKLVGHPFKLPGHVLAYRAHRPGETDWISYTLDLETAKKFARHRGVSRVSAYRVPRAQILCLFTRRGESEIIVLNRSAARHENVIDVES